MTDYPGLDIEGTEFIIDQGCVHFGVDSPSPDLWYDKTYPCHSVCSERWVTLMKIYVILINYLENDSPLLDFH
jgi:kynurenine formamidase